MAKKTNENIYKWAGIFGIITIAIAIISAPFLFVSLYEFFTNNYSIEDLASTTTFVSLLGIASIAGIIYLVFTIMSLFKVSQIHNVQNLKNLTIALIVCLVLTLIPFIGFLASIALIVVYVLIGIQILNIKEAQ
ncbi:MAG: hypothetical protein N2504_00285 [candidate division WOR-3 bacterium]|nr:hypothetical protein [candidate division WOR-3 bacterium]